MSSYYCFMVLLFYGFRVSKNKLAFHVSRKILISDPRFSRFDLKDPHHFSAPAFSKVVNIFDVQNLEFFWVSNILRFVKLICFKMFQGFFLICFRCPGGSKDKIVGFGARGHAQKSRNHGNEEFWVLL